MPISAEEDWDIDQLLDAQSLAAHGDTSVDTSVQDVSQIDNIGSVPNVIGTISHQSEVTGIIPIDLICCFFYTAFHFTTFCCYAE